MTAAIRLYHDCLPQLCERLKSATEPWLRSLWRRLMMQHATRVLSVIVKQWQLLIRTKHSVIYQLVSTHTATGYCGMDEYRICTERYKEHLTNIRDSDYSDDKKYAFMSRNGGPGAWIFIPYIFTHIPVPKRELLTLESREIQLYPRHLNKEQRYRREMVKKGRPVNPVHAARARNLPRANWNNRGETPVRLQLMHGSGLTPSPSVHTECGGNRPRISIQHSTVPSLSHLADTARQQGCHSASPREIRGALPAPWFR